MVRVLVVHDAALLRSALVQLLRSADGLEVSSMPARGDEPDDHALPVDVCVVDGHCLEGPRDEVARASFWDRCGTRLVVLAAPERPGVLRRAFDAGVLGFLDKDAPARRLIDAVHMVAKGERFLDERLTVALLRALEMPLTARELSVLSEASRGSSVAEIAVGLHLSRGTVRNYLASAIRKVGARNRVDAIRIVQNAGWL
ncbi:response regulator transcription factor [Streptomyces mutabilis]|jgi:two-component system response regulator DesR|uniref:response regulator transcription factor n=1 Tax=Streptomyces mutabilis TaxID=67332 RepID=UPI0022BA6E3B|nr:response regulator transcription factor [Streptomyces mutabilis]MCZ9351689.1 response regulator transcription factor [Streptomyces mutabilis]